MREVVDRMVLHDHPELLDRGAVAAALEVGAPERLADRALVRLHLRRLLQRDRGRGEVTVLQQVTATLDAYPDKPFPAKVRTVIPTADRQKATVKVRITILNLEKYDFILPDMGVKVAFLENEQPARRGKSKDKEKGPQAVAFIPKSAVRSDANVSFVLLVRDGKVERRAVSLGLDRGTEVAVLSGVAPGDSLVVKGPEGLHDGDKVEIR